MNNNLNTIHSGYMAYLKTNSRTENLENIPENGLKRIITNFILTIFISIQLVLGYQIYQLNYYSKVTFNEANEERFSKVNKILKFLLDNAQSGTYSLSSTYDSGQTELPTAKVTASKLYLRSGPGLNHSPLMAVAEGTTLVIEDTTDENWIRVIAPNGERAYAAKNKLQLINQG